MKIRYAGTSFRGLVRKNNEDNLYLNGEYLDKNHEDSPIYVGESETARFAVFDGMGGEEDGEMASYIAASNYKDKDLFHINQNIIRYAREKHLEYCGTTAATLTAKDRTITITNIGDSRIYLYRDQELRQISKDHIRIWRGRRYLIQALGDSSFMIEPYQVTFDNPSQGKYLLCTDGLTDMLTDEEISRWMSAPPADAIIGLKKCVLEKGAVDNTTMIAAEIK